MQDVVLMACGTPEGAMAFCRANGVSISDMPTAGTVYVIPEGIPTNSAALKELATGGTVIGTMALKPCPIVTEVVAETVTHEAATITYTGSSEYGEQWQMEGDTAWTAVSGGTIELTGLDPATEYTVRIRTVCLENYSAPVEVVFTTEAAPLELTVVLRPDFVADVKPGVTYKLLEGDNFVNVNELVAFPSIGNVIKFGEEPVIGGGGLPLETIIEVGSDPADKFLRYNIGTTLTEPLYIGYSDLGSSNACSTWKDSEDNRAKYSPVVLIDDELNHNLLIGGITLTVLSATSSELELKLTRTHPTITMGSIGVSDWEWTGDAAGGAAVPGDDNSTVVTLEAGTHTLGVSHEYYNSGGSWALPGSLREMVIEVALP